MSLLENTDIKLLFFLFKNVFGYYTIFKIFTQNIQSVKNTLEMRIKINLDLLFIERLPCLIQHFKHVSTNIRKKKQAL